MQKMSIDFIKTRHIAKFYHQNTLNILIKNTHTITAMHCSNIKGVFFMSKAKKNQENQIKNDNNKNNKNNNNSNNNNNNINEKL